MCLCLLCQQRDSDCPVFCSSVSVPLFIVPAKRPRLPCVLLFISQCAFVYHVNQQRRLRLPSVSFFFRLPCVSLFISECAFVYHASKETQTAMCFVLLHLSVPLFIVPTRRLRLPHILLFITVCAFVYCYVQ